MPIVIIREMIDGEPYNCVKIECDHCGRLIEDADLGAYYWYRTYKDGSPTRSDPNRATAIFYTHKICMDLFETSHDDVIWLWEELHRFPCFMANNIGIQMRLIR